MMGKKKAVKKTKEVSVAIAESSSAITTEPLQIPRKRGRPRKVMPDKDVDKEDNIRQQAAQEFLEFEGTATDSKRARISEEEEKEEEEKGDKEKILEEIKEVVGSSSNCWKEEEEEKGSPKKQERKSRAKKKGKPRKSS